MPIKSRYRWNAGAGRYTLGGRFVARREILTSLQGALNNTRAIVAGLSAQLVSGSITLITWERLMREAIKDAHLYSTALARGGWAQLTPADYGRVGNAVQRQYVYLNRFAAELELGLPLDGRFTTRAQMYIKAARTTYYRTLSELQEALGMTEERNLRHARDSCSGCIEASAQGWVPIGTLPEIGGRDCLTNCLCDLEYR